MIPTGKIIVLAFPDTFVKMSDEWQCKLMPIVGLGTWNKIKAGHAALILIENKTGKANYYDFGRYVTPKGYGRVRSAETDAELEIPIKAKLIGNGPVENLNEILLWLEAHPEKTHGDGRLIASVSEEVNFEKAQEYIINLQKKGSVPYKAFKKEGSNCARFVTDTILASVTNEKIQKKLNHIKKFSPSTVGNVEISASNTVYEVFEGKIKEYTGSALKENLINYFKREKKVLRTTTQLPLLPNNAKKLSGIGSNAWFSVLVEDTFNNVFKIERYNDYHNLDYVGFYKCENTFNPLLDFEMDYDSHCLYCHVIQDGKKIKLVKVKTCQQFSQLQKSYSA